MFFFCSFCGSLALRGPMEGPGGLGVCKSSQNDLELEVNIDFSLRLFGSWALFRTCRPSQKPIVFGDAGHHNIMKMQYNTRSLELKKTNEKVTSECGMFPLCLYVISWTRSDFYALGHFLASILGPTDGLCLAYPSM